MLVFNYRVFSLVLRLYVRITRVDSRPPSTYTLVEGRNRGLGTVDPDRLPDFVATCVGVETVPVSQTETVPISPGRRTRRWRWTRRVSLGDRVLPRSVCRDDESLDPVVQTQNGYSEGSLPLS